MGWGKAEIVSSLTSFFRCAAFASLFVGAITWSRPPTEVPSEIALRAQKLKNSVERLPYGSQLHRNFLVNRYLFKPDEIHFSAPVPLILREGLDPQLPIQNPDRPVVDIQTYDVVIIGSGPAGLTAGVYLTDAGKRVLVLEKNRDLGGLAASGNRLGLQFARGGAYFASAADELLEIYKHIGLENYEEQFAIPEPIDTYAWNDRTFEEIWNDETLKDMPASFAALKYALKRLEDDNRVPDQPFEFFPWIEETDSITMEEWVRRIPRMLEYWAPDDEKAAKVLEELKKFGDLEDEDLMKGPLGLLELYGRSALGDHPTEISAAAFINFYLNELETRYTGNRGAGEVSHSAYQKLLTRPKLARFKTGARVTKVEMSSRSPKTDYEKIHGSGVEVTYESNGILYKVFAKDAVFAAPLRLANKTIVNYETLAPEQHKLTNELEYRDYMVINVHVAGHPWVSAYDLWVRRDSDYSQEWITDIIDGRWMDFKGREMPRTDDRGVLTIYMPLDKEKSRGKMSREEAMRLATVGIEQMKSFLDPLIEKEGGEPISVLAAEVNFWEDAIHVAKPGHFRAARKLQKPVGRIHFANNNIGTPSIEEALYRGKRVAEEINRAETCEGALSRAAR